MTISCRFSSVFSLPLCEIFLFSIILLSCTPKLPFIESIDPKIGKPGDIITIYGENFGEQQNESYITIADARKRDASSKVTVAPI